MRNTNWNRIPSLEPRPSGGLLYSSPSPTAALQAAAAAATHCCALWEMVTQRRGFLRTSASEQCIACQEQGLSLSVFANQHLYQTIISPSIIFSNLPHLLPLSPLPTPPVPSLVLPLERKCFQSSCREILNKEHARDAIA